ncbi:hypothetical protein [Mesorhizobium sp. M0619]|uniref:hypothetical protein n=1 Tax=unclassified Mesorhizobium TaxID=325217 RepID=UPI0033386D5E
MDHIVTLDSRREAALQAVAEKFVAVHKGDVMKALKEMIVLNGRLQQQLDARSGPRPGRRNEREHLAFGR